MTETPLSQNPDQLFEEEERWPYPLPPQPVWAPASDVLTLVAHAVFAAEHEERLPDGPALVFVHDEGLYLADNGLPHLAPAPGQQARQRVVHLRAPRGRVLDTWAPSNRYAGTGSDFAVVWPLTPQDPERIAAVGPTGRVVVTWTERGPRWDAVRGRPARARRS